MSPVLMVYRTVGEGLGATRTTDRGVLERVRGSCRNLIHATFDSFGSLSRLIRSDGNPLGEYRTLQYSSS